MGDFDRHLKYECIVDGKQKYVDFGIFKANDSQSAIPRHQPTADHLINMLPLLWDFNKSHILRFAEQSNMCLTMRLLFSQKRQDY